MEPFEQQLILAGPEVCAAEMPHNDILFTPLVIPSPRTNSTLVSLLYEVSSSMQTPNTHGCTPAPPPASPAHQRDREQHYQLQGLMRLLATANDLDRTTAKKSNDEGLIGPKGWSIAWQCCIWSGLWFCRACSCDWWRRVRSATYRSVSEDAEGDVTIMIPICTSHSKVLIKRVVYGVILSWCGAC